MATTTRPTINPTARRSDAVRTFLAAKAAKDAAEAALKEAREVLLRVLPDEGEIVVDATKVVVYAAERREVDLEALADTVTPEVFASVTKAVIDLPQFDAHVLTGDISDDVADSVTTIVPVPTVRVQGVK